MAGAAFSIKLRCASWPQLATIYRRDLSRGQMFLKANNQPPIGTIVRIDLELPSATVIELQGTIVKHVTDPQRGTGVDLQLDPLPTKSVWMIESALAAENKVRTSTGGSDAGITPPASANAPSGLTDGSEISEAEAELMRALEAEAESLRKLNPFLVLGVGYETTDNDVRAAFGELTKRYHPDRFARYQSVKLRQIAAEIFILIRDAYRRLADDKGRQQVLATLGPKVPTRAQTQPRASAAPPAAVVPPRAQTQPGVGNAPHAPAVVPKASGPAVAARPASIPPKANPHETPTANPHDAPTNPSAKPAELANTDLARPEDLAVPVDPRGHTSRAPAPTPPKGSMSVSSAPPSPTATTDKLVGPPPTIKKPTDGVDASAVEALIDEGKLEEAVAGFRTLAKKHPGDKSIRAGIELVEGLRSLVARDRMEAAQRFEAALELDPSNERAARELADMRRQATNERKGLLSRLMGKKEPPP